MNEISILEAERYFANAKEILKDKAILKGDYYTDSKYVKMAANTAWSGVLIAMQYKMIKKGFIFPSDGRKNVDIYRKYLAENNKTILKDFNAAYNYLHLFGVMMATYV